MSLWGNSDNLTIANAPATGTVVGAAGSEFWTVVVGSGITFVPTGTTIIFSLVGGVPGSAGFGVLESHLSDTVGKINIRSGVPGSVELLYSQQPIQFAHDPGYNGWSGLEEGSVTVSGAAVVANPDFAEIGRTQMPTAINTPTFDAVNGTIWEEGVGWVGVTTYMALNPDTSTYELRVKTETLVAMSGGSDVAGIETGNRPYPETFGG